MSSSNDPNVDARACPVGENERWSVLFESITNWRSVTDIFKDYYGNWFSVDQFRYQGSPMDEIDFVTEDRVIKGLKVPGMRQELSKKSQNILEAVYECMQETVGAQFSVEPNIMVIFSKCAPRAPRTTTLISLDCFRAFQRA